MNRDILFVKFFHLLLSNSFIFSRNNSLDVYNITFYSSDSHAIVVLFLFSFSCFSNIIRSVFSFVNSNVFE